MTDAILTLAHALCPHINPDDEGCRKCPLRDPGPRGGVRGCILDAERAARDAIAAMAPAPRAAGTDPVEAVARAMHAVSLAAEEDDTKPKNWDGEHPDHQAEFRAMAAAAIAAMQAPSP